MKAPVLSRDGEEVQTIELPAQFDEYVRDDLIKKAVLAIQANKRQPDGAKEDAGLQHSTDWSKRRRSHGTFYGRGVSRSPRKILLQRGRQMYGVGAEAPNTVGGRRAHPPTAEKDYSKSINRKERRKAIRAAIAATADSERVAERGHNVSDMDVPLVVDAEIESLERTQDVEKVLTQLGLADELERCSHKKRRAGKGTMRNRPYKRKVGPLLVVGDAENIEKAARNLPGVDVVSVENLNAELLAPGTHPGRLAVWSKPAIEAMEEEELFW